MPKILISYRREDSAAYAGRLADRLRDHFGRENVFVDIDAIPPGEDFVEAIEKSVSSCNVLVALIGRGWLTAADTAGHRRLDRSDDFVRTEIAKALERHVRVIPALVGDAVMPEAKDLPQDLLALTRRQAIEISDTRFHQDVDRLIEALSGTPSAGPKEARPTRVAADDPQKKTIPAWPWILATIVVVLGAAAAWRWTSSNGTAEGGAAVRAPQDAAKSSEPLESAAPRGSAAARPGPEVPAPSISDDAPGKTGIKIVWRGANDAPCYLYDATGQKLLSPAGEVWAWRCSASGALWDAAPGKYMLKVGAVAVDPIPIAVTAGKVVRVEPRLGQLRLHWNGSNRVLWYLLDKEGEKTLSPPGEVWAWDCEPGKTKTADVGPGDYVIKVNAVGYEPIKVRVAPFRVTEVTLP